MNDIIKITGVDGKHETMTSIQIAEITGKQHSHVMRDIRNVLDQGVSESNFGLGSYTDANGMERPCYFLTKKGCLILASGYDVKLREKIIDRWEELESTHSKFEIPQSFSEALMLAAKQAEQIEAQQKQLKEQAPKVLFSDEQNLLRGAIFFVEYEKGAGNLPNELRTNLGMPDETAGDIYYRRLLEVRALPVKRDNLEKLLMFTGGGTMQIPRTPGGLAVYSFPTENGVMLDVPEGNFIVLAPDGKFGKMDMQTFMANFEEKDANTAGLTFDEKRLFEKMNKLFGKNFQMRFLKLTEEYHELFVVADDMLVNGIIPENTSEIIDELADLNAVLFHIAALFGYSQKELQEMAYKKIAGREKNPDFMRKHPHTEPGKYVCENCNKFEIMDGDDGGFCKEQKKNEEPQLFILQSVAGKTDRRGIQTF